MYTPGPSIWGLGWASACEDSQRPVWIKGLEVRGTEQRAGKTWKPEVEGQAWLESGFGRRAEVGEDGWS